MTEPARPRVLVITARRWYRHLSHAIVLDFEDAMGQVAEVSWLHLPPDAMSHLPPRHRVEAPAGAPFDLALFVAMAPSWMRALRAVKELPRVARSVAVYVFDAWPYATRGLRRWRREWSAVDHLFLAYPQAVELYGSRLSCRVHPLVQGTSPERFHPVERPAKVDLLSIGRRDEAAHRRLVALARREQLLYVFGDRASSYALDLEDTRYLSGALSRTAAVHLSWAVEHTSPRRAAGFSPVTARGFEGAACAAAVLGRRPRTPLFDELFPLDGFCAELDAGERGFDERILEALHGGGDRSARLELSEHVRTQHSWQRRCESILTATL